MDKTLNNSSSVNESVKSRKCPLLKERLKTLIYKRGMTEPEFFNSLNITRQNWYYISWGLDNTPLGLKIKIAQALDTDTSNIWRED